jgi:polyferredoxin
VRDRSTLARQVEDGEVENVYRLQIMNATEMPQNYRVTVDGLPGLRLRDAVAVSIAPTEARWVSVTLRVPAETATQTPAGAHEVHFNIEREAQGSEPARSLREKSTFVLPR